MVDCYERLANAIVLAAVQDYREVLQRWSMHPEKDSYQQEKRDLERFFRSKWFSLLTNVNPEVLMAQLIQEVA